MNQKKKNTSYSIGYRQWKKFKRNRLALVALCVLIIMITMCAFAPLLTSYDPEGISLKERDQPPNAEHILGTDKTGRDVFARMLYGGRISMIIGLSGALGGALIGSTLGCVSGYFGGIGDRLLVRVAEVFSSFPQTILVLAMVSFMGQGIQNMFIVFWSTGWMGTFRLVRARVMSVREENFVQACGAFGLPHRSIMFNHILPNCIGPVIVNTTLAIAGYVLAESGLSFLGLGVPNSIPTWGNIINAAKSLTVVQESPWLWLVPGITITIFSMCVNVMGDGLRDALDPNQ